MTVAPTALLQILWCQRHLSSHDVKQIDAASVDAREREGSTCLREGSTSTKPFATYDGLPCGTGVRRQVHFTHLRSCRPLLLKCRLKSFAQLRA